MAVSTKKALFSATIPLLGPVAQSVEQRIENPCVGGSIPPQATKFHALLFQRGIFNSAASCRKNLPCFEQGIIFSKTFT